MPISPRPICRIPALGIPSLYYRFKRANSITPIAGCPTSIKPKRRKRSCLTDMAKVLIPTPLRQFTAKQDSVTVSGATVGEVLSALTTQFPELRKQIFNDEGKLRSFVNVYLNDEDIRYLGKDATPAADADTLSLVPSIAGGAR